MLLFGVGRQDVSQYASRLSEVPLPLQYWPLRYRLITPELQWQSRGKRRILPGPESRCHAVCADAPPRKMRTEYVRGAYREGRVCTDPLPVRYALCMYEVSYREG